MTSYWLGPQKNGARARAGDVVQPEKGPPVWTESVFGEDYNKLG
jgi:hypothetical protein